MSQLPLHPAKKKEEPEDCAQCFYQPGAAKTEEKPADDCAQCFYQPEAPKEEQSGDCPQCFYQPDKK